MKKILGVLGLIALIFASTAFQYSSSNCDIRSLKNELLIKLKPEYRYDSYKVSRITYTGKQQVIEIAAPLFEGEDFRFLFNIAGMPNDVDIKIYNQKKSKKNRTALFSLLEQKEDGKNVYIFDPQENKTIYINYIIPRTGRPDKTGCMVCVIGCKTAK